MISQGAEPGSTCPGSNSANTWAGGTGPSRPPETTCCQPLPQVCRGWPKAFQPQVTGGSRVRYPPPPPPSFPACQGRIRTYLGSGVTLQTPRDTLTVPDVSPEASSVGWNRTGVAGNRTGQSWTQLVQGPSGTQATCPRSGLPWTCMLLPLLEVQAQLSGELGARQHPRPQATPRLPPFSHVKIEDNQSSSGKWLLPRLAWAGRGWTQQGDGRGARLPRQARAQPALAV